MKRPALRVPVASPVLLAALASAASAQSFDIELILANPSGTGTGRPVLGDVNGDGLEDLLAFSGSVSHVCINRGDGSFKPPKPVSLAWGYTSTFGDLDNDGLMDAVHVSTSIGEIAVQWGNGIAGDWFDDPVGFPGMFLSNMASLGDVNGDGLTDIVVAYGDWSPGGVSSHLNDGNRNFVHIESEPLPGCDTFYVDTGDVNGDGFDDAVAIDASSNIMLFISRGDGLFKDPTTPPGTTHGYGNVFVRDVDTDDEDEVVSFGGEMEVFNWIGDSSLGPPEIQPVSISSQGPVIADLDKDHDFDVAGVSYSERLIRIGQGDGFGDFSTIGALPATSNTARMAYADLDDDGDPDLVSSGVDGGQMVVYWNRQEQLSSPWEQLAGSLAGVGDRDPLLHGSGEALAGTPFALTTSGGKSEAATVLVFGTTEVQLPLLGGTLVPFPDVVLTSVVTGSYGFGHFEADWPAGAISGLAISSQLWILDPLAPEGLSATNGLRGTTP